MERLELEKKVHEMMAPCEYAIYDAAVKPIIKAALPPLPREISTHNRPRRKQPAENHIGTKVHVMMAIKSCWF